MDTYTALLPGTMTAWSVSYSYPSSRGEEASSSGTLLRSLVDDRAEAEQIVADLETLLQTADQWNASRYQEALAQFHPRAVTLFFTGDPSLAPSEPEPWDLREGLLPFPEEQEDYRRLLLVGTTGAGKTSLLRQCLGLTHPDFPATDTSRTTTFALEAVCDPDANPQGVISLVSQTELSKLLFACIERAVIPAMQGESDHQIKSALNSSNEQRFHLPALLGETPQVRLKFSSPKALIAIIRDIADEAMRAMGFDGTRLLRTQDEEILSHWLQQQSERCAALIDALLLEIRGRLTIEDHGTWQFDPFGWPIAVHFQTATIPDLEACLWPFAGVEKEHWVQLFTPLVTGMRMRAPFCPKWWPVKEGPRVILLDGEGVGHAKQVKNFLPSRLADQLPLVDAIIAVEKADTPMQNVAAAIIRTTATRGMIERVILTYTHCDLLETGVGGPRNFHKLEEAEFALIDQLSKPEEGDTVPALTRSDAFRLRRHLEEHTYHLGYLHQNPLPQGDAEEAQR